MRRFSFETRHVAAFCLEWEITPYAIAGVAGFLPMTTLDKTNMPTTTVPCSISARRFIRFTYSGKSPNFPACLPLCIKNGRFF